jgi:Subtilase family
LKHHKISLRGSGFFIIIVFMLMVCFETVCFSEQPKNIQTSKSILIKLGKTHFDPLKKVPEAKSKLNKIQAYTPGEIGYYIVQFDKPIEKAWKKTLKERGVDLFDYIQDFAFIIRMDPAKEQIIRGLPNVRWLGIYQPSYKISQNVLNEMADKKSRLKDDEIPHVSLHISVFPNENIDAIKKRITERGGSIKETTTTTWKTKFKIDIRADKISDLPSISGVKWIETVPEWKLFNNVSTDILNVRSPRNNFGLYGMGQTVGIADTGLDKGSTNPANLHDDFENGAASSRVTALIDRVGDGANDVRSGHGTHVAGSVLGNGDLSGSNPTSNYFPPACFAGIAPKANLVFQSIENNSSGYLTGIPEDLNVLFGQAKSFGANLHTNSWGAAYPSMYTSNSEEVDQFMWNNPDFLILFSAGNEGIDWDMDGIIDLYNIGAPATAKNCLTVGASEGNRPDGAGYDSLWGYLWPYDYPVDPIFSDHVSDNPNGMAAFSSRGPVLDERYKPDIVAPGTNILSTRSSVASGSLWGWYDSNYVWSGGTSMSTPLAAGGAALMREYLIKEKGFTSPSAALIKAALLNSAKDITPGQYGTGSYREIPNPPVPNNVEGWGRLDLGNGVYPSSPFEILYFDVKGQGSLSTGEFDEYTVTVDDPSKPLKVNLVWTDYPGSPTVNGGLVNDLDLKVTDPSSNIHYPDHALPNPSNFDRVNNVVGLTLLNPGTGTYTVRITGYNVPSGPQPYALVVSGNISMVAGIFQDVPPGYWAEDAIYKIYNAGITTGCSQTPLRYCPEDPTNRTQMAVFLGKAVHGSNFTPPSPTGIFNDVPESYWAADWIEQFYNDGITSGCGTNPLRYCPTNPATRAQMAIFLLRAKHGSSYTPPPATGIFNDVPTGYWAAAWIEQLYNEGITTGCGTSPLRYCPENTVTRAQMAVFIVRTFGL